MDDVAISFLSRDQSLALKLYEELSTTLSVFVHPKRQEEVAGTDGMESLRSVFLSGCLLAVVLYRSEWGQNGWTGVEAQAIRDRAMDGGWQSVLFVKLDEQSSLPTWWPPSQLNLHFSQYSADLAGAIRVRAQQLEAEIRVESARDRAKAVAIRRQQAALRAEMLSQRGQSASQAEFQKLLAALDLQIRDMNADAQLGIEIGFTGRRVTLRVGKASILIESTVLDPYDLECTEFHGRLPLPGEAPMYWPGDEPERRREWKYTFDYQPGVDWCWQVKNGTYLPTADLAEEILKLLLSLYEKSASTAAARRKAADGPSSWMS